MTWFIYRIPTTIVNAHYFGTGVGCRRADVGGLRGGRRGLVICLMDGRHSVSEQCFPKAAATSVSGLTAQTTSTAGAHPSGRFTTSCVCVYKCVTRAGKAHPSVCETINIMHHRASDCQPDVCDLWLWLSPLHAAVACRHVCKGQFSAFEWDPSPPPPPPPHPSQKDEV